MYLYDDDAKVYSTITCDSDHLHLQEVIDHIKEWCDQWLLPLNINKCSHMSYTSRLCIDTAYHINNTDSVSNIQKVDQIKDLGILYDSHKKRSLWSCWIIQVMVTICFSGIGSERLRLGAAIQSTVLAWLSSWKIGPKLTELTWIGLPRRQHSVLIYLRETERPCFFAFKSK